MERDFVEMLSALNAAGAEYLVVGAHALAAHGVPRATGDLDIWVRGTPENAGRVLAALRAFGAPLFNLTTDDLSCPETVFQIGVVPVPDRPPDEHFRSRFRRGVVREDLGVHRGRDVRSAGTGRAAPKQAGDRRPKDLLDVESLTGVAGDR